MFQVRTAIVSVQTYCQELCLQLTGALKLNTMHTRCCAVTNFWTATGFQLWAEAVLHPGRSDRSKAHVGSNGPAANNPDATVAHVYSTGGSTLANVPLYITVRPASSASSASALTLCAGE
jgi:hypothetical protein